MTKGFRKETYKKLPPSAKKNDQWQKLDLA
jgi:hypothetical protein